MLPEDAVAEQLYTLWMRRWPRFSGRTLGHLKHAVVVALDFPFSITAPGEYWFRVNKEGSRPFKLSDENFPTDWDLMEPDPDWKPQPSLEVLRAQQWLADAEARKAEAERGRREARMIRLGAPGRELVEILDMEEGQLYELHGEAIGKEPVLARLERFTMRMARGAPKLFHFEGMRVLLSSKDWPRKWFAVQPRADDLRQRPSER